MIDFRVSLTVYMNCGIILIRLLSRVAGKGVEENE
jgi:hypothetical protein